jgi:hypothetical protein
MGSGRAQAGQPVQSVASRSTTRQAVGVEATSPNNSG